MFLGVYLGKIKVSEKTDIFIKPLYRGLDHGKKTITQRMAFTTTQ